MGGICCWIFQTFHCALSTMNGKLLSSLSLSPLSRISATFGISLCFSSRRSMLSFPSISLRVVVTWDESTTQRAAAERDEKSFLPPFLPLKYSIFFSLLVVILISYMPRLEDTSFIYDFQCRKKEKTRVKNVTNSKKNVVTVALQSLCANPQQKMLSKSWRYQSEAESSQFNGANNHEKSFIKCSRWEFKREWERKAKWTDDDTLTLRSWVATEWAVNEVFTQWFKASINRTIKRALRSSDPDSSANLEERNACDKSNHHFSSPLLLSLKF